jgi:hypothetical protein
MPHRAQVFNGELKEESVMSTTDKLQILETLVDELLKDAPEEKVVKSCMNAAGLHDTKDPIDRINKVLLALQFEEKGKEFKE